VAQRVPGRGARPAAQPRGGHAAAVGVVRRAPQVRLFCGFLYSFCMVHARKRMLWVSAAAQHRRGTCLCPLHACRHALACTQASSASHLRCRLLVPPCSCCAVRGGAAVLVVADAHSV
jgi:hypothetical protein